MTNLIQRSGLCSLAVAAGCLLPAGPAVAQQSDLLRKTQQELQVEAQRLEAIVSDALLTSRDVGNANPARAREILLAAKSRLEDDSGALQPDRRQALLRKIEVALRAYADDATSRVVTPGTSTPGTGRRTDEASRQADQQRIRDEVTAINQLRRQGKTDEAARRAAALASQYPDNLAATGAGIISGRQGALATIRDTNRQSNDAFTRVNLEILKSSIPPKGDIVFPADWVEKMRKRYKGIQLTDLEKKIVVALGKPMPMDVEGKPFKEVIDYMRQQSGVPIVVDQRALDDLNITYNTPVNLKIGKVSMRTVLKRLLGDLQLTYVMKDEAIQITTPARAKEMLTVRVYSVADLMPAADMRMPLAMSQAQGYQTLQQLVTMITQTVEPDSWEVNGKGGMGTIVFDPVRFVLVVKQSAEMHYLMGLSALAR